MSSSRRAGRFPAPFTDLQFDDFAHLCVARILAIGYRALGPAVRPAGPVTDKPALVRGGQAVASFATAKGENVFDL
jgi:hypothetical protein